MNKRINGSNERLRIYGGRESKAPAFRIVTAPTTITTTKAINNNGKKRIYTTITYLHTKTKKPSHPLNSN